MSALLFPVLAETRNVSLLHDTSTHTSFSGQAIHHGITAPLHSLQRVTLPYRYLHSSVHNKEKEIDLITIALKM